METLRRDGNIALSFTGEKILDIDKNLHEHTREKTLNLIIKRAAFYQVLTILTVRKYLYILKDLTL